jgi:hypothetical protein
MVLKKGDQGGMEWANMLLMVRLIVMEESVMNSLWAQRTQKV